MSQDERIAASAQKAGMETIGKGLEAIAKALPKPPLTQASAIRARRDMIVMVVWEPDGVKVHDVLLFSSTEQSMVDHLENLIEKGGYLTRRFTRSVIV